MRISIPESAPPKYVLELGLLLDCIGIKGNRVITTEARTLGVGLLTTALCSAKGPVVLIDIGGSSVDVSMMKWHADHTQYDIMASAGNYSAGFVVENAIVRYYEMFMNGTTNGQMEVDAGEKQLRIMR